ncbi:major facilitator superfamily MFS_1 [Gemmatirosa kalamazoonensis]|uniref:Major facilitator superfamily MFS_1 n=1 Tax=Gemmatirosa kalamazoonensis TaxID=861299 RepID=W0REZ0_9BACT|nr:MFS transporter [Gemmatirosa kalamazoonensis]AHG88895.1 major facilitator superfamily MFS_1 [Gemmatirosa kalamazoonensis]
MAEVAVAAPAPVVDAGALGWWRAGDRAARRALVAASLGWALDAFDVMLFSLTLAAVIAELGLTKAQAGALGSITLLGGAAGGLVFGHVADRWGRTRALMASVLLYSVFTAACGLSTTLWQFALFRVLLGLGMGGEWASGAALVAETWPARHRGRALGMMQSSWAIGFAAAAVVVGLVLPRWGWRTVYFVGVAPALLTLWVRRNVEEPAVWRARRDAPVGAVRPRFADMFRGPMRRLTAAVTFMNACALFGWWGLNSWIPAYLSLPTAQGGVGLGTRTMSWFVVAMQVGMWLGYVSFGYVSDAVGRKRVYVTYLLAASVLLPLYGAVASPPALLLLGPLVAFFGTGYYSGFGAVTAEIYPTAIRATAQGFTYNLGRVASAAAPFTVGTLAASRGFGTAFAVAGAAFLLGAVAWVWIPETQGRELA